MGYTKLKKSHLIKHKIHKATSNEYLRILILRTVGNFLILSSLFMIGKTFYKPVTEEAKYFVNSLVKKKFVLVLPGKKENVDEQIQKIAIQESKAQKCFLTKTFNIKQVEALVPEDPNFSIVVPKIGANARILPNTDASDENIYLDALNKGVAHTLGTAFPGEGGHIFLFAHSTDYFWRVGTYNAIFYLLNKLEPKDEVNLFYKGQRYVYRVIDKRVVDPSEVTYLTRKTNKEFLTLQTCWPPGTTLKRLLVFAVRVAE